MQAKEKINSEKSYSKKLELLRPALLSYTNKRVFNKQDAEDIVQNVLLILYIKKLEYNANKSFFCWAFSICYFQIRGYLTRRKREAAFLSREKNPRVADEFLIQEYNNSPRKFLYEKEKRSVYSQIKSSLNLKEKNIFKLTFSGLTPKEIKNNLKMNHNNYSINRHRALEKAKKFFSNKSIKDHQP
jgi:RNA polymerase sigma factor (sigma-70 family)